LENPLCKITLLVPASGTDRIVELMLASEPLLSGFTMWSADGHGESFKSAAIAEQVRGRVERTVFMAVMERLRAKALIEEIGKKAPIPHMAYWIEPVLEFGRTTATDEERESTEPHAAKKRQP